MTVWDELAAHASLTFDRARMLPVAAYTDPDVLATEIAELFGRGWTCVGRAADIPEPGDHLTAELPVGDGSTTRSIIVVRDDAGTIRAFDNVCVHRGAQLLDGCGNASRITCPYHAWVYRLDGSLVGGPYLQETVEADGHPFDPTAHALESITTEIWQGFVFVATDPHAASQVEPLGSRLAGLTEIVARYDMASYVPVRNETVVWPTNWKLLVENFMDAYHVFHVHRDSFGADGDNTLDTVMFPGDQHWTHHRVVHADGPDLAAAARTGLAGDWRKTLVLAAIYPGFVIQLQPDWLWYLRINPIGTDRVRIDQQIAIAPETLAEAADAEDSERYVRELIALVDLVNSEDLPVVAGVRRSVDRPQFSRAPFSRLERNVFDFDHYVAHRLNRHRATTLSPHRREN